MRPAAVVVLSVDPKNPVEMARAKDKQPVQALGAKGPHELTRTALNTGSTSAVSQYDVCYQVTQKPQPFEHPAGSNKGRDSLSCLCVGLPGLGGA